MFISSSYSRASLDFDLVGKATRTLGSAAGIEERRLAAQVLSLARARSELFGRGGKLQRYGLRQIQTDRQIILSVFTEAWIGIKNSA